jgi:hypothetical protein
MLLGKDMNDAQKILKLEQYIKVLKKALQDMDETIKKLLAEHSINRSKWAE